MFHGTKVVRVADYRVSGRRFTYLVHLLLFSHLFVAFGCRDENRQNADELEDGPQKQPVAEGALEEGGFWDVWRRQVQVCRHVAPLFGVLQQPKGRKEDAVTYIACPTLHVTQRITVHSAPVLSRQELLRITVRLLRLAFVLFKAATMKIQHLPATLVFLFREMKFD